MRHIPFFALLSMVFAVPAGAQDLSVILPADAQLERVAGGFQFAEGPVWDGEALLVSDVRGDTVYIVDETGDKRTFKTPSHWANGHTWDRSGALLAAEHASGALTRQVGDGPAETIADRFEGKRLNSPNDVIVRSDGTIFFTDPTFGLQPPSGPVKRPAELDYAGVYSVDPETRDLRLLTPALAAPNGLALSPDESRLYVTDFATKRILAFDVAADGALSGSRVFADFAGVDARGGVDGMKVDAAGHVYAVCPGGVCVLDADGVRLGTIETPERATNVAWGGEDLNVLYITTPSGLYRIPTRMNGAGSGIRPSDRAGETTR